MKKTVLVTGSSRGIGRAIALKYAEHGYNVVINCARSTDRLEQVKKEAETLGAACLAVQADVGIWEDCVRLFAQIQEHFGDLDILVNNAGISWIGLLQDMDVSQWNTLIASNLSSVFHCCKLAVPGMVKSSQAALSIFPLYGASAALPVRQPIPPPRAAWEPLPRLLPRNWLPPGSRSMPLPAAPSIRK